MINYDLFLSYRVSTDQANAKLLFHEFRADQVKETKVFWDSAELTIGNYWRDQFLASLKRSRAFVPIISNKFTDNLDAKLMSDELVDNVLLEWDTILECRQNGSGQIIIPIFVKDENGPFNFTKAAAAMKEFKAKDCKRTAKEIWDVFSKSQGKMVDVCVLDSVKLFVREVQERISKEPPISPSPHSRPPYPQLMQFNLYEIDDPEIFIDCTHILKQIEEVFKNGNMCNLKGIGGSGKTFVANKCAFLFLANGYNIAKFTADNEGNLTRDFSTYLKRMLNVDKLPVTAGKVREYLRLLNNSNLSKQFIILDNVKELKDVEDFEHSRNPDIKFLITSRTFITHPAITKDFYSEEACTEFLKKKTKRGFSTEQCKTIFEITNGFPLRLALAARTLRIPTERFNDYVAAVEKKKSEMKFHFDPDAEGTDDVDELFPEVSLSIDKLNKSVNCGHLYLALLANLQPDLIVEKYLVSSLEEYQSTLSVWPWQSNEIFRLNAAQIKKARLGALQLGIVENAGFQSSDDEESSMYCAIKIHRCVQAEIRDRIKKQKALETAAEDVGMYYNLAISSYNTLISELKAEKVDDATMLLQKWERCEIEVDRYELSSRDLETLSKAISKNTSLKMVWFREVEDKSLDFLHSLASSKINQLGVCK
ncbi:hypothetical protein HK098_003771 [Nowakowskiella sp. JEL0407]|nr:hypothetical protein HK098_003771 [Nowakowskiella sp. JEL0407]